MLLRTQPRIKVTTNHDHFGWLAVMGPIYKNDKPRVQYFHIYCKLLTAKHTIINNNHVWFIFIKLWFAPLEAFIIESFIHYIRVIILAYIPLFNADFVINNTTLIYISIFILWPEGSTVHHNTWRNHTFRPNRNTKW